MNSSQGISKFVLKLVLISIIWLGGVLLASLLLPGFMFGSISAIVVIVGCVAPIAIGLGQWTKEKFSGGRAKLLTAVSLIVTWAGTFLLVVHHCKWRGDLSRPIAEKMVATLEAYRGEQGEYPTELSKLVPEYMDKLPKSTSPIGPVSIDYLRLNDDYRLRCPVIDGSGWLYTPKHPEGEWRPVD